MTDTTQLENIDMYIACQEKFGMKPENEIDLSMEEGSGNCHALTLGDLKHVLNLAKQTAKTEIMNDRLAQAVCASLGGMMVTEISIGPKLQKEASPAYLDMVRQLAFVGILKRYYDRGMPEYMLFKTTSDFREMAIKFNLTMTPEAQKEALAAFKQ